MIETTFAIVFVVFCMQFSSILRSEGSEIIMRVAVS